MYMVPFWPEPKQNRILKNGRISGQPELEPYISYIPSLMLDPARISRRTFAHFVE